ncbi:MAG: hypothetical protein ACYDD6_12315 [Acidimicrobiales bacterium]
MPPGAAAGTSLFTRSVQGGTTVTGYSAGSSACPSASAIDVVVQHGSKRQGFFAAMSGTQQHPVIEINTYATFANFPIVVISHVDPSISRVAWVSGNQTYDEMTPVDSWVAEVGPFLPLSLWQENKPDTVEGALIAYSGTREVASSEVSGQNALPPSAPWYTACG